MFNLTNRLTMVVVLALGMIVPSSASQSGQGLSAQDYADIQQLYARYAHGFDSKADGGQMYLGVFADDGQFEDQFDTITLGRDALLAKYGRTQTGHPNPISNSHSTWNVVIDPAPWGAVGRAYKSMGISFSADGKPVPSGVPGMYYDILIKTPSGWRFQQRIFRQEFQRPASSGRANARQSINP